MADIYYAYTFLNEALDLKLSPAQLNVAEQYFKKRFAERNGLMTSDIDEWEFFGELRPRLVRKDDELDISPEVRAALKGAAKS